MRQHLQDLRLKEGLTQEQLAKKLSISAVYFGKIERGVEDPGRKTMIKYREYYRMNLEELFPEFFLAV